MTGRSQRKAQKLPSEEKSTVVETMKLSCVSESAEEAWKHIMIRPYLIVAPTLNTKFYFCPHNFSLITKKTSNADSVPPSPDNPSMSKLCLVHVPHEKRKRSSSHTRNISLFFLFLFLLINNFLF